MSLLSLKLQHKLFSLREAHVAATIRTANGITRIEFNGIIQASSEGDFVDFMEVADEGSFSRPAQFFKITKEIIPYVQIPQSDESAPIEIVIPDNIVLNVT